MMGELRQLTHQSDRVDRQIQHHVRQFDRVHPKGGANFRIFTVRRQCHAKGSRKGLVGLDQQLAGFELERDVRVDRCCH